MGQERKKRSGRREGGGGSVEVKYIEREKGRREGDSGRKSRGNIKSGRKECGD